MGSALQPTPELFANSEVEPWVDGYPGDLDGDGVLGDVVAGIWQQDRWSNGGSRDNRGAISFDSGATWQAITFAGITECTGGPFDRDTDPWLTFAPNGDLHIMHLGLDIDAPPGQPGGSAPTPCSPRRSGRPQELIPDVAVDPNTGRLYAAWMDTRFSPAGSHNDIALTISDDGGLTWTEPVTVNSTRDSLTGPDGNAFLPSVHCLPDGTVGVSYYDFRFNDPASGGTDTDHWLVHCHAPSEDCSVASSWDERDGGLGCVRGARVRAPLALVGRQSEAAPSAFTIPAPENDVLPPWP